MPADAAKRLCFPFGILLNMTRLYFSSSRTIQISHTELFCPRITSRSRKDGRLNMKIDFSKPLSDQQKEKVQKVLDAQGDPVQTAIQMNENPDDIYVWTMQELEEERQSLNAKAKEGMTPELMHGINRLFEKETSLCKAWEDWKKEQPNRK